jgi:hypothetical protein
MTLVTSRGDGEGVVLGVGRGPWTLPRRQWLSRHGRIWLALAASSVALMVTTGCSSGSPEPDAATRVAERFSSAISDNDGARACALLSPAAAAEVAKSEGRPCPKAIGSLQLPASRTITGSKVYVQSAQVRSDKDVLFLSRFDGRWKIVAAGCRQRPDHPYDCLVQAG